MEALKAGFVAVDADLRVQFGKAPSPTAAGAGAIPRGRELPGGLRDISGSTATTVLITPTHIIFGNCGDSRGLLSREDKVFFATLDHKPSNPEESTRIRGAGGFVEAGRVCGNLAVSRALGDFQCAFFLYFFLLFLFIIYGFLTFFFFHLRV